MSCEAGGSPCQHAHVERQLRCLTQASYRAVAAAAQADSQALLPGSSSIIMHDIACAQLEELIAKGQWDQAYALAVNLLQANLTNMYHKARRPAFSI